MNARSTGFIPLILRSAIPLFFVGAVAYSGYYGFVKCFPEHRGTALFASVLSVIVGAGANANVTYPKVRTQFFHNPKSWEQVQSKLTVSLGLTIVVSMFFGLYLAVIIFLGRAVRPLANSILVDVPAWVRAVSSLVTFTLMLLSLGFGYVLSFFAVRWFWKLTYPRSKSDMRQKGSDG
jgi:hypothetical protein